MKKVLVDTNAYIAYLKGDNKITDILNSADIVYMSIFVLGELHTGFKGGNKEKQNKLYLKKFINKSIVQILEATNETAEFFGIIKNHLKSKGTPLPINDVWIAAHVMETSSLLISYDKHFKNIANIRLWDY